MIALLTAGAWAETPAAKIDAALVVVTGDRVAVGDALVAEAEAAGGWFDARTPEQVTLRVPPDKVDGILADAASCGRVVGRLLDRTDVSTPLADLGSRIDSANAMLDRYYLELGTASSTYVLQLERTLDGAIGKLEALETERRALDESARFATIQVAFRLIDRQAPTPAAASSPFAWIASLDPQELGRAVGGPADRRPDVVLSAPEGFSSWGRGSLTAVSPDGVRFRARLVRDVPVAPAAFWGEAVQRELESDGYRWIGGESLAGAGPGRVSEVAMPAGPDDDDEYLVAFFPVGDAMVVVEAVGEIGAVSARRDAILAAAARVRPRHP